MGDHECAEEEWNDEKNKCRDWDSVLVVNVQNVQGFSPIEITMCSQASSANAEVLQCHIVCGGTVCMQSSPRAWLIRDLDL